MTFKDRHRRLAKIVQCASLMLKSDSDLTIITLFCVYFYFIFIFVLLAATFTADKIEKDEIQKFHKFYRMRCWLWRRFGNDSMLLNVP